MLDRYDSNEFETVTYQASSGGLSCPESDARIAYYSVTGYPTLLFNGTTRVVGAGSDAANGSAYEPLVQGLLDEPSPLRMEVFDHGFGDATGFIELNVVAEEAIPDPSHMVVRVAILEDHCAYGGTTYDNVLRDMLPDIPLTADEPFELQLVDETFPLDGAWNTDNLRLVAWVQDDSSREVLQTVSSRPIPPYSLRYYALGERSVIADAAHTYGDAVLFNVGTETDDVTISLDTADLPADWNAAFAINGVDYTTYDVTLVQGERVGMNLTITPGSAGQGTVRLVFHSQSGQVTDKIVSYSLITSDTEILLVDDDGAFAYETEYFAPALDPLGRSYAIWDRNSAGLSSAILENFDIVVWSCGWAFPTVDADDRAALAAYLDQGGNLFITGQDIGWEMNDEGGAAIAWYHEYLHANFINDDTNDYTLEGIEGDAIGDGLLLTISGGDGANNQDYPSDIDPRDAAASTVLRYDASRNGAIKADAGTYRVVYFAFGYEAIDNAADRALVMQRVIDWLDPPTAIGEGPAARDLALLGNVPNPFNPKTDIVFRLGSAGDVELAVYDLAGRRLRELLHGPRVAGEHRVAWDGRDDAGRALPAGTYVYRLTGAGRTATGKMVLVK